MTYLQDDVIHDVVVDVVALDTRSLNIIILAESIGSDDWREVIDDLVHKGLWKDIQSCSREGTSEPC